MQFFNAIKMLYTSVIDFSRLALPSRISLRLSESDSKTVILLTLERHDDTAALNFLLHVAI